MSPDAPPIEPPATASPETLALHETSQRKWNRYQHWRYLSVVIGAMLLALIGGALIVLVVVVIGQNSRIYGLTQQLATLGRQNHDNTEATKQAVQILIDCTTPGHDCYEKGQQSTRTAVQGLNAAADARAICAQDVTNDTVTKLEACMVDKLAHR